MVSITFAFVSNQGDNVSCGIRPASQPVTSEIFHPLEFFWRLARPDSLRLIDRFLSCLVIIPALHQFFLVLP
jgi:hypothetical protein